MVDFVTLKAGPTVDRAALHLALDLEQRGFTLKATAGVLHVTASSEEVRGTLTDADRAQIKLNKGPILGILDYCERLSRSLESAT